MSGNTFGTRFRVTTWGESHGPALGVVIDGCPSNLPLTEKDIQEEVDKRKPKKNSKISTNRHEADKVEILSGVFEGKTTGTPISILIRNKNTRSKDYKNIKNIYRPGHADLSYDLKYGIRDYRGGGRSSGRETVARVAGGAIAKKILTKHKTKITGKIIQIGDLKGKNLKPAQIEKYIGEIRQQGDSIGSIIEIIVKNPPKGLGDPVFDKLDAKLTQAIMSIGSIKGVEIGAGFKVAEMKGSENNDQMQAQNKKIKFLSNHSGGILGGISTGEDIVIRAAIKPVPSIPHSQKTISKNLKNTTIKTLGRHDCCLAPRIIPVAKNMVALTLVDFLV
jgi:chorismate synthase